MSNSGEGNLRDLRDYFAGKAMQSLMTEESLHPEVPGYAKNITKLAYIMAEQMMTTREERNAND